MNLKGYRTILVNALAAIPLFLESAVHVLALPEVVSILPDAWLPWYGLALALINLVLRSITTTPMGRAE